MLNDRLIAAPINYWTAWNVNAFNKLVSILRQLGLIAMIHKVNSKLLSKAVNHDPNKSEAAYLTVEVKGIIANKERVRVISLATFSDYHTTARVTASLAKISLQKEVEGVVCPFELTNLDELVSVMKCT